MKLKFLLGYFILAALNIDASVNATSMVAIGACYSVCAGVMVSCFLMNGFIFGTLRRAEINAVVDLHKCNQAFSQCERACFQNLVN